MFQRSLWLGLAVGTLLVGRAVIASADPIPTVVSHGPDLKLMRDRFAVRVSWQTPGGPVAVATPVQLTAQAGLFWFFDAANLEVLVKVLSACGTSSDHFWVFAAGLTNLGVTVEVTDLATGAKQIYRNPQGAAFPSVQDSSAFATCAIAPACGLGGAAEIAQTPRPTGDSSLAAEPLAVILGGGFMADQDVYERVLGDLASITAQEPAVAPIEYWPNKTMASMVVHVDLGTYQQIAGGSYSAWNCLNSWYKATSFNPLYLSGTATSGYVIVNYDGIYDIDKIAPDYRSLPGLLDAYADGIFPPPEMAFRSACAFAQGDMFNYFVPAAVGSPYQLFYFISRTGSAPRLQGVYDADHPSQAWKPLADACSSTYTVLPF